MTTHNYYGDNFPVPSGQWNSAVPWKFPSVEGSQEGFKKALPWFTLGIGLTLGALLMAFCLSSPVAQGGAVEGQRIEKSAGVESFTPVRGEQVRERIPSRTV